MGNDFATFVVVGFLAQVVDGALGMAFGVLTTTVLLAFGVPPAQASALVHTVEIFTTGASAASHIMQRNVQRRLVFQLAVTGVLGAIAGAWLLSNVDAGLVRPFVSAYLLLLGLSILWQAVQNPPEKDTVPGFTGPLGFIGGFLDAAGGGGWGPTVTCTLIGAGRPPRFVIGSVNTAEFFVTTAAATTFFIELGSVPLEALLGLTLGGVAAAPFGALLARYMPPRALMTAVGLVISCLSAWQIARSVGLL